jgi:hypothetical protein
MQEVLGTHCTFKASPQGKLPSCHIVPGAPREDDDGADPQRPLQLTTDPTVHARDTTPQSFRFSKKRGSVE